jgi:hypothetical protein
LIFDFLIFFYLVKDFCRDAVGNFVAAAAIRHDAFCLFIAQERLCRMSVEHCTPLATPPSRHPFFSKDTINIFVFVESDIYIFLLFWRRDDMTVRRGFVLCFPVAIQYL